MSQYHITVQEGSRLPPVRRCSQCCMSYHCPLCGPHVYKPAHRYKVHRHLKCHLSRAVRFKGYSIYKCNLGCRPQAHFHCFCEKLFLNRNQFIHHLNTKHEFLPATDHGGGGDDDDDGAEETLPLSPSSGQQPNADPSPTCAPVGDTPSSCEANSVTTWTSGAFSSIAAPPVSEGPALNNELASAPSGESEIGPERLAVRPQCNMVRNIRCLHMHMKMKHSSRAAGVTSSSPLRESINATTESPPVVGGSECHLNPTPVELEILTQLRVLQQQQSQILQLLLKLTNTGGVNDSTAADLGAVFPVTDEEGLATLALKLIETPDLKNRLISFLGDNDGLPIDQTVQRILERMLSNTFAKRMDWRGKNNKVSFASSCLKEIVNDAVRRNSVCARAADEAVESVVKKWLQQAGERDEGAEGRREEREVHH
ncbi:nucleotide triphosphate diphosphatase NUDT15 isoform X1 [Xiphias gladius]|uniref:nucleotide triphosphate diphosphatase NUDT15 isoform X1 n=1 Tax=Xiphias gladius TaxID=8245 RepID=UPI001A98E4AB|nr:nucleotide triphosphate diphosphatase NUDT15 isoform X1 [Xiphias gladius]XP_039998366.1 nucleotide triphosphate diphosphatase NUDT15 isoform X1 [Xiphias gladius]